MAKPPAAWRGRRGREEEQGSIQCVNQEVFIFTLQEMSVLCVSCLPVEILQGLVSGSLRGSLGQVVSSPAEQEGMVGPVSLPRRAETFGGFDSHQMNVSKGQWGF